MKLVTANIKSNPLMRQSRVLHDVARVKLLGGVILWQEIAPKRYKSALESELSSVHHWSHVQIGRETPISYRNDTWKLLSSGHRLTHHGRAHVTPARYITWAVLQRKNSTFPPVVFMNTHMISSAFSNHHPLTKKWRLARWKEHFAIQKALVQSFVAQGYTVIGGGDFNCTHLPKFTGNQRFLSHGGIDHMYVCEAPQGVQVELRELGNYTRVYTDHAPRYAELWFHHPVD